MFFLLSIMVAVYFLSIGYWSRWRQWAWDTVVGASKKTTPISMNGLSLTKKSHFSSCPAALLCILPSAAILSMTFSLCLLHLHLSNLHVLRFPPFSSSHHPCYMSLLSLSDEYYNNSTLTYLSQRQSALLLVITVPPRLHCHSTYTRPQVDIPVVHLLSTFPIYPSLPPFSTPTNTPVSPREPGV